MSRLLDGHPDQFIAIQCHTSGTASCSWGVSRASYYGVTGVPTTWFDGTLERSGAYTDDAQMFSWYRSAMNNRLAVPTDVTVDIDVVQTGSQSFEATATVGIEADGTGKQVTIEMVRVLDYYPAYSDNRYRNCVREGVSPQTVTLSPGETTTLSAEFTLSGTDWTNKENAKVVAWARDPGSSAPNVVYQAGQAQLWMPVEGDANGDGMVNIADLAIVLASYRMCSGDSGYDARGDLDGDDCVNFSDLAILLANYGYGT